MKSSLLLLFAFLTRLPVMAQGVAAPDSVARQGLFADDAVLSFTLTAPLQKVLKDRGDKPATHLAQLSYAAGSATDTLPVKLTVRGNFRRKRVNCVFPPLYVDFPKKKVRGTPFAHQNKLKLVTHCQSDEYVVREYLVYRLYNLLTEASFRARLARVTYVDSAGKRPPETRWAALLEDEDDLVKRNGAIPNKLRQHGMPDMDSLSMATVAVFQYLIGNTDWSVPYRHNIRLLTLNDHTPPVPVPYDFDHSGLVDANYALPAEQLGIASVRERLYRGLAYSPALFQLVFERFTQLKPQFYALYQNDARLDPAYIKRTLRYFDDFYATISKPTTVRTVFLGGNRSNVVIKGLK